jgi:hypothetical protein
LLFDTQTPTSSEGSHVIRIEKDGNVRTVDLTSIKPNCVQVNRSFTRLLLKRQDRVDVYDLKTVLQNASLDGAGLGSVVDSSLSVSAFFVGDTDDIVTSHWDNRVLRWRRTAGGYVGEAIYSGDYPIRYAEPDSRGKRLLMIEDYGQGSVAGILYSVSAQKKWTTVVSNYKWIGLAFTTDDGIVFGESVWEEKNSNYMNVKKLGEFVGDAKRLASRGCGAKSSDDFTRSPCWPDLSAE